MSIPATLRTAALAGIVAANLVRIRELLGKPAPVVPEVEPTGCSASMTRLSGEVVHCFQGRGHENFHAGVAVDVPRYTWPEDASDTPKAGRACDCNCKELQSDISQTAADWVWRVYDLDCDRQERLFAVGASKDLETAREDVVAMFGQLTNLVGATYHPVSHTVEHHVDANVHYPVKADPS